MALDAFVHRWTGTTYRNAPRPFRERVLDFQLEGRLQDNRWNVHGERTLYLGGDPVLAIAEFTRHLQLDRSPLLIPQALERDVFALKTALDRVLDFRDQRVLQALSITGAPDCFKAISLARAAAQLIRYGATRAQAIIVPSMAFLDDPNRWVMVRFLDNLPNDPRSFISSITLHSTIAVSRLPGSV